MKHVYKGAALFAAVFVVSGIAAAVPAKESLDIAFVDSFKAMRECKEGERVGKELDTMRDKLSKEIQDEAMKITKDESDLKSKASTIKPDMLAKQERELSKQKRALEEKVRESEEEIKLAMQQKTEELAVKIEEGIVAVAKDKGVDAVIDKMTGRVMYTKDERKGDITVDAIAYINKKSSTVAKQGDEPKAKTATT